MNSEKTSLVVRAPGKLTLLGEYAVLEEGSPAIAVAVNKCIYCNISKSDKFLFSSSRINISNTKFSYKENKVEINDKNKLDVLKFVKNSIEIALNYLSENNVKIKKFRINILSDLNNKNGIKYGFGSSASVTVVIISAILYFHGINIHLQENKEKIFKLSAISHFKSQGSGSGIDVAAATFGGIFIYKSYTSDWLSRKIKVMNSLNSLLNEPWKFLYYDYLFYTLEINLCVGWTKKAASTKEFIKNIMKVKYSDNETDIDFYVNFIKSSNKIVELFQKALEKGNKELINKAIKMNLKILKDLSKKANVTMETEELKYLVAIARKIGLEGKFSGAGGGDCGYAIAFEEDKMKQVKGLWKKYNIEPLDIKIDGIGVSDINFAQEEGWDGQKINNDRKVDHIINKKNIRSRF